MSTVMRSLIPNENDMYEATYFKVVFIKMYVYRWWKFMKNFDFNSICFIDYMQIRN